ncbi:MAG: diguanylate cyclase [Thermoleophilaceae bacterium]|nr:diguanylate cyclase [Thermoleophilaceae bacterium]
MAAAVWFAGDRQRSAADGSFAEIEAVQSMLVAMLDQQDGFNGFLATGAPSSMRRYERGRRALEHAIARSEATQRDPEEIEGLRRQSRAARGWQQLAAAHLEHVASGVERRPTKAEVTRLDRMVREFRVANSDLTADLDEERHAHQERAVEVTVALILLISAAFGAVGFFAFDRRARFTHERDKAHSRFTEALQLARSETEAFAVVRRYLERLVPGGNATILSRNNSANRLEARSPVEDPTLAAALDGATPESCLAIRGGRPHSRCGPSDDLIGCEICGAHGENVTCVPSLVGGEVIGSVLMAHPSRLGRDDADTLASSLAEAAPIVANLRNLAIAELRAATDALTGLPNNRAVQETLKRMAAQAGRTASPLAVVLFDLDNFKEVNDEYGHGKGDEVLAAVGDTLAATMRDGDFVGRYGGEEFLALLPATDRGGAMEGAQRMRRAIAKLDVAGINRRVTASFGVAVLPDDAGEGEQALRLADRALYTAKRNGRDRVESAEQLPRENGVPAETPA